MIDPADQAAIAAPEVPIYFAVSTVKLLLLSLSTLGLYQFYWFYKNWQLIKAREQSRISPSWRAFFGYFFCYALFRRIRESAQTTGAQSLPAELLTTAWIITNLLAGIPDPYWLLTFLSVVFLVPVQVAANRVNAAQAPLHDPNARFTSGNIATVIIGGLLLVLAVILAFTPAGTGMGEI